MTTVRTVVYIFIMMMTSHQVICNKLVTRETSEDDENIGNVFTDFLSSLSKLFDPEDTGNDTNVTNLNDSLTNSTSLQYDDTWWTESNFTTMPDNSEC